MNSKYRKALEEQMEKNGISEDQLLELIDYKKSTLYGEFKRNEDDQEPFKKSTIRKLKLAMDIDCEKFLLPLDKEKEMLGKFFKTDDARKKLFTRDYWEQVKPFQSKPDSIRAIYPIVSKDYLSNSDLIDAYEKIKPIYKCAQNKIQVHDVLSKGDNKKPGNFKAYSRAQGLIYESIEETLPRRLAEGAHDFKYIRIFHLSKSERLFQKPQDNERKLIRAFIGETPKISLIHILYCLDNFKDNCEFYISKESELRSKALIDQETLITEDYYVQSKASIPHYITIYNTPSGCKANIFLQGRPVKFPPYSLIKLNKNNLYDGIKNAASYLDNQITKRENVLSQLEKMPQVDYIKDLIDREKKDLLSFRFQRQDVLNKKENIFKS